MLHLGLISAGCITNVLKTMVQVAEKLLLWAYGHLKPEEQPLPTCDLNVP